MMLLGRFEGWRALVAVAICWAQLSAPASAQQMPSPPSNPLPSSGSGGNLAEFIFRKSPYEFWLTCLIIAFGLIVLGLYIYAVRDIKDRRPEDVSRALIVITVITGSLILITAGYSNEQIAPAFGLFGTVIGYMLGRMSGPSAAAGGKSDPEQPPKDEK